jgi:hypothetical protein
MTSSSKLKVNVFDRYFFGAPSCVKGKVPELVEFVFRQQDYDGITLFVDACMYEEAEHVNSRYKVGWLLEARGLHIGDYERACKLINRLDFILTYDAELLRNAGFVPYVKGGIWIPRGLWGTPPKRKFCSMLYGAKTVPMEGYKVRHEVAEIAKSFGVDLFYEIGRDADAKVRALSEYAFTIVVDACRQDNCFSENLLDPIMLGCVPIHWGALNIGEFLNPCGIIQVNGVAEVSSVLETLTKRPYQQVYQQHLPHLIENQKKAAQWEITEDYMARRILLPFLAGVPTSIINRPFP